MKNLFFALLCSFPLLLFGQTAYSTQIHDVRVGTIQVHPEDDPLGPTVVFFNGAPITIKLDYLDDFYPDIFYRIIHCDADWSPSKDFESYRYIKGLSENQVLDITQSINSNIPYTHYELSIPNNDVSLRVSGNYAVEFFDIDQPQHTIATACFSLVDNKVKTSVGVKGLQQIRRDGRNQELEIKVSHPGINIPIPERDLKVRVVQNNNLLDRRILTKPFFIEKDKLTYSQETNLLFRGGNEFHRFENSSIRKRNLNVYEVTYADPFFHFILEPNKTNTRSYNSKGDNDGKVFIKTDNGANEQVSGDYTYVHFSLTQDQPLLQGGLYLHGDFAQILPLEQRKMIYNFDTRTYELSMMLKQGIYEYQFLYQPSGKNEFSIADLEGNFWETDNLYEVYVYYRSIGGRYDQLVDYRRARRR